MAYGINKFDKKLLTPYIKRIQTNKQENYTRKLDQSEEIQGDLEGRLVLGGLATKAKRRNMLQLWEIGQFHLSPSGPQTVFSLTEP